MTEIDEDVAPLISSDVSPDCPRYHWYDVAGVAVTESVAGLTRSYNVSCGWWLMTGTQRLMVNAGVCETQPASRVMVAQYVAAAVAVKV